MALREILIWPDPRLKQKAKPVGEVDAKIRKLCDDMAESMYEANGVGLAAPQVGGVALAIGNADPLPHAAYATVGAGRLIRCDRRLRSDVDWRTCTCGASTNHDRERGRQKAAHAAQATSHT